MVLLERWTPYRDLEFLDRQLSWLLKSLPVGSATSPAADIYENGDEIVVELEVPGYEQDELDVELSDHTLAVSGHREKKAQDAPHLHERMEGAFERRFALPANTDTAHLAATYGKGVLTLHIPKTSQEAVKVPIEHA
jgi:HSP20 family protein